MSQFALSGPLVMLRQMHALKQPSPQKSKLGFFRKVRQEGMWSMPMKKGGKQIYRMSLPDLLYKRGCHRHFPESTQTHCNHPHLCHCSLLGTASWKQSNSPLYMRLQAGCSGQTGQALEIQKGLLKHIVKMDKPGIFYIFTVNIITLMYCHDE